MIRPWQSVYRARSIGLSMVACLVIFGAGCQSYGTANEIRALDCGWQTDLSIDNDTDPQLALAGEQAPEPLAWRAKPTFWIAPELIVFMDRPFAQAMVDASGFAPMSMAERSDASIRIWPFFAAGSRRRPVGENVLCARPCVWEDAGPNPEYVVAYMISPLVIRSYPLTAPSAPPDHWFQNFERLESPADPRPRTNVDGVVRFDRNLRIDAAECFINIDLPAAEKALLISECIARSLGLVRIARNGGPTLLQERMAIPSALSAVDENDVQACLRSLYSEGSGKFRALRGA